ncbi:MAG: crotonase/enoyl-CoA hydratase family protein [Armatimonadetes bacterium]|nr:crotonase/enoyl-CoA hydratase family protein [Armatimonadota bacterium]
MSERIHFASFEVRDDIGWIVMDDGKANAIHPKLLESLESRLEESLQAGVRAVVLSGRPGFFSAGLDRKLLPAMPDAELYAALAAFFHLTKRLLGFPLPVVAAVTGHAVAAGSVILLACDAAVACRGDYRIGLNETTLGIPLPPFLVEMARLKLRPRNLMGALAGGELYSVEEALDVGFLDGVCEPPRLAGRCADLASTMAAIPNRAYHETKLALRSAPLHLETQTLIENLIAFFRGKGNPGSAAH